jgi:hypothetical protein
MDSIPNIFVTAERRAWMRLRDHIVIFEGDPAFVRFCKDPSGSILRVLRIWVETPVPDSQRVQHYVGSVRRCQCGGWMSHRELCRLFRRASVTARRLGEDASIFRTRLATFLREYFEEQD